MTRPRVLLADDHTLLLEAFRKLLDDECDVVGMVGDGRALVAEATRLKPDVVVVDVAMPLLNGVDAARQIKQTLPETRIVFLTMNEDPDLSGGGIPRRGVRVPVETIRGVGAVDGDPRGRAAPVLCHPARHRRAGRIDDAGRGRLWHFLAPHRAAA